MGDLIILCPNPYRDGGLEITKHLRKILELAAHKTAVCPIFDGEGSGVVPEDIVRSDLTECLPEASLVVVIGGDGTILHAAREAAKFAVPVVGVNAGSKGFLAALERDEDAALLTAAAGEYALERRMMLDVSLIRNEEIIYRDQAINDAVIHGFGDCIRMTVWCDGDKITSFSGDGVILATPTGSSAYSLSAGGPLVEPTARNIILTPVCVHAMSAKSFVLGPERIVSARADNLRGRRAFLTVDGSDPVELCVGDAVQVMQSKHEVLMADVGSRSFYDIAFEKLIERDR